MTAREMRFAFTAAAQVIAKWEDAVRALFHQAMCGRSPRSGARNVAVGASPRWPKPRRMEAAERRRNLPSIIRRRSAAARNPHLAFPRAVAHGYTPLAAPRPATPLPQPPRVVKNRARRDGSTNRHRRGYSLIEALVVISINSVLMAVALTLFGTLLKSERHGRQHFEQTRTIMRLADDLRHDAATAERAETDPTKGNLRFRSSDDRTVEFVRDEDRIRRVESAGSAVVRREAYHLAGLSQAKFVVSANRMISVELRIGDEPEAPWRIDARLDGGRRFILAEDAP